MIYTIRHGKTELNKANVLQGRSNYPLNEEGKQQAKEAAAQLQGIVFDYIFTSPLTRAVQTAEIIVPGTSMIIDDRLISTHAIAMKGLLEYLTPDSQGSYWSKYIGNCTIYAFDNAGGTYSIPVEYKFHA